MNEGTCVHCDAPLIPELMTCPHCHEPADHPIPTDLRCDCGFLLCKLTEETIEIKCRRCRRIIQLPLHDLPAVFERRLSQPQPAPRPRTDDRTRPDDRPQTYDRPRTDDRPRPADRGQICQSCGQFKPSVVYGKCIQCRTESIKVQYKSKHR